MAKVTWEELGLSWQDAEVWRCYRFTAMHARAWMREGFADPKIASYWRNWGPRNARRWLEAGVTTGDETYNWLSMFSGDLRTTFAWIQTGIPRQRVADWVDLLGSGTSGRLLAPRFDQRGWNPTEQDEVTALLAMGSTGLQRLGWTDFTPEIAILAMAAGYTHQEVRSMDLDDPLVMAELRSINVIDRDDQEETWVAPVLTLVR